MNTIKRDGRSEEIDIDKIHRVLTWAADGLEDVSISEVELRSHIQFYEGIKTSDIQQILIKTAADMISDRAPDYQYFAARLAIFDLHKRVYGEWNRPLLGTIINDNCSRGVYDSEVFDTYTIQDILYLEDRIDDSRDLTFSYAAAKQLESKYLVQDRSTGEVFETPQILYMTMAMALFYNMTGQDRLDRVVDFYNATSTFKISLPTPIMAGVRTRTRQFSSCTLIDCGDSLNSINATSNSIVKYVSQRAGIGINGGRIRALGAKVRDGEISHTGCIPFYKLFAAALKSCSQG